MADSEPITVWMSQSDGPCVLGRDPECDIVIQDATVSGVHAKVTDMGSMFFVEDLGSLNGTYHNGIQRIRFYVVDGLPVYFGSAPVVFRRPAQQQTRHAASTTLCTDGARRSAVSTLGDPQVVQGNLENEGMGPVATRSTEPRQQGTSSALYNRWLRYLNDDAAITSCIMRNISLNSMQFWKWRVELQEVIEEPGTSEIKIATWIVTNPTDDFARDFEPVQYDDCANIIIENVTTLLDKVGTHIPQVRGLISRLTVGSEEQQRIAEQIARTFNRHAGASLREISRTLQQLKARKSLILEQDTDWGGIARGIGAGVLVAINPWIGIPAVIANFYGESKKKESLQKVANEVDQFFERTLQLADEATDKALIAAKEIDEMTFQKYGKAIEVVLRIIAENPAAKDATWDALGDDWYSSLRQDASSLRENVPWLADEIRGLNLSREVMELFA